MKWLCKSYYGNKKKSTLYLWPIYLWRILAVSSVLLILDFHQKRGDTYQTVSFCVTVTKRYQVLYERYSKLSVIGRITLILSDLASQYIVTWKDVWFNFFFEKTSCRTWITRLTFAMLKKIKMTHPLLIVSQSNYLIQIHLRNDKQCRSRSVGFFSQMIWIFTVYKDRVYSGSAGQGLIVRSKTSCTPWKRELSTVEIPAWNIQQRPYAGYLDGV